MDNVIGETDQLYAYVDSYSPYKERYDVGNVKIGIKTPDGVLLLWTVKLPKCWRKSCKIWLNRGHC